MSGQSGVSKLPLGKSSPRVGTISAPKFHSCDQKPSEISNQLEARLDMLQTLVNKMNTGEKDSFENVFQEEMNKVKNLVKDVTRERVQCEAELKRQRQTSSELKIKSSGYQQQILDTKKLLQTRENEVVELESKLSEAETQLVIAESENSLLQSEVQKLQKPTDENTAVGKYGQQLSSHTKPKGQLSQGLQEQVEEKMSLLQNHLQELQRCLESLACQRKKVYDPLYIKCKRELAALVVPTDSLRSFLEHEEPEEAKLQEQPAKPSLRKSQSKGNKPHSSTEETTMSKSEDLSSKEDVKDVKKSPSFVTAVVVLLFPLLLLTLLMYWTTVESYLEDFDF